MSSVRRQLATPGTRSAEHSPALAGLLRQSALVEAKVEECAEEIAAITAMLKEEIDPRQPSRDAEQALIQGEQVKTKIEQCAQELHSVNAALSQEMRERRKSERALAGMQVRLIGAQIDLLEAQSELTRIKDEREKARYFAFHDALTGLPNPNLFNDRMEHALAHAKRYHHALAVMCIGVDKFRSVDEAHSHQIGDKALQTIAGRLHSSMRASDTVARRREDQFLFLLEELPDRGSAEPVARKLIRAISQPLEIEGLHLSAAASVGIAMYPRDGETAETLIANAESAMHKAKRNAAGYAFFNPRYF
jgi:diguanylate cyclase (GGDEF)-like protein